MYLDRNNLYRWAMSQKWPVNGFKWNKYTSKFNKNFIKNYDENSNKRYIFEEDVEYPKISMIYIMSFHFLQKEWNKLVCNLHDKNNCYLYKNLKEQALKHGFRKQQRVTQFIQKAWLKSYIDMNIKLRKKAKTDFEKYFLS